MTRCGGTRTRSKTMDERNITFMFYGLAVAWGILAVYAVLLGLREQDLKKQLETLKKMVEEKK